MTGMVDILTFLRKIQKKLNWSHRTQKKHNFHLDTVLDVLLVVGLNVFLQNMWINTIGRFTEKNRMIDW